MMMNALAVLACLAADDVPFPVFERDPWTGFAADATVTRTTTSRKETSEETVTVKVVDREGVTLQVGAVDLPWRFTSFSRMLVDGAKLKATGRSNKLVSIGTRRVKALVREFAPEGGFGPHVRVVTADEFPGGVVEVSYSAEDDKNKLSVTYGFKALDRLKVAGRDVECARYELAVREGTNTKKFEGTYWLSSQVPGLLVRAWQKQIEGREMAETFIEVTRFESKK